VSIEYEAKILNIAKDKFIKQLEALGAKRVGSYNFKRYVFDTIPVCKNKWVRLRTDGTETTITCKEIVGDTIDGTIENEISVNDFDKALEVLIALGLTPRGYQENVREEFKLDSVQVTVDSWPLLEDYAEIEGNNSGDVVNTASRLGYSENDLVCKNTDELYKEKGIDLKKVKELKFE